MHSRFPRLSEVKRFLRRSQELEISPQGVQRLKWFVFALEHDKNISLTCRHFGIARSTFLCWLRRFDVKNVTSLEDHSRRPHSVNVSHTNAEVLAIIKMLRMQQTMISKHEIQKILQEQYGVNLSSSTIGREITRHNFFFGDTPSHRAKRGELRVTGVENIESISVQPTEEEQTLFMLHSPSYLPS